jgi:hypothetical protein
MEATVISIKDYEFRDIRKKNKYHEKPDCEHRRLDLHENGEYITCQDCGVQVSGFWALKHMLQAYKDAWRDIEIARKQVNELCREKRFLRSLNMIDKAWRGKRQNAVCCPHCKAAILPEDDLGARQTSAILERKRREKLNN